MAYSVGDVLRLRVTATSSDGSGIARGDDGMVLFIPGALPEEEISARVTVRKREYAIATVDTVHGPNPRRTPPFCPHFGQCGGCQLQHADYALQLDLKREMLLDALRRIFKGPFPDVPPCVGSPEQTGYRNKASLPVRRASGRTALGFFAPRSHRIVPIESCPVLAQAIDTPMAGLPAILDELGLTLYSEEAHKGLLRHVILRQGLRTGESLFSLVLNGRLSPEEERRVQRTLIPFLQREMSGLRSVTVNRNTVRGNVILGGETRPLLGGGVIEERLGGFRFTYDTTAFFQINPLQAETLYKHVAQRASAWERRSILELYSGIGTLTVFLAKECGRVTAVEEWEPSIERMRDNLEANGLSDRVRVLPGAVEGHIGSMKGAYDCVVLDPPRTGCSDVVVRGLVSLAPKMVLYVSCNPATLARDMAKLIEGGYALDEITCFDMFPQTSHVETVAILSCRG